MIYTMRDLVGRANVQSTDPLRMWRWVRAVPLPFYGSYLSSAWEVFRGRAVAVRYPTHGELERALYETGGINVSASPAAETQEP